MYVVHTASEIAYATAEPVTPPPGFLVSEVAIPPLFASSVKDLLRVVDGQVLPKCTVGLYPERQHLVADGVNQVVVRLWVHHRQAVDSFRSVPLWVDGQVVEVPLDERDEGLFVFTTTQPGEHVLEVKGNDTFTPSRIVLQAVRP